MKEESKAFKMILLLLGGLGGSSIVMFVIFIIIMIAPLMILGIIDVKGLSNSDGNGLAYSDISSSSGFWWPIGGSEIEIENGVEFARGDPTSTGITSGTGHRVINGYSGDHKGIDIDGELDKDYIIAAQDGTVYEAYDGCPTIGDYGSDCGGGWGNHVIIDHGNSILTIYGHMSSGSVKVKTGDSVKQGQVLGRVGSSGSSTGSHLHFQVDIGGYNNDNAVDPLTYVDPDNPRPVRSSGGSGLLDFTDFKFVAGSSDQQSICLTLKANGLSDVAAAGIMGNIEQESSYSPTAINGSGCIGIVQWCDRSAKVIEVYGDNWNILENQLEFVFYELANNESANKSYLSQNIGVEDMAYRFCMGYERPGEADCNSGKRQSFARSKLPYVQNGCR